MINLNLPFRKSEKPVEVAAVAISSELNVDKAKAALEAAGFAVDQAETDDDGNTIFKQEGEFDPKSCTLLKLSDQHGVLLRNAGKFLKKAAELLDFSDNLGSAQFIPGLFLSQETLAKTVMGILEDADSRDEAVKAIKAAAASFGEHVGGLAEAIPADVFKLEGIDAVSGETQPEGEASDDAGKVEKTEAGAAGESAKPEGEGAEDVKKEEADPVPDTSDDEGGKKVEKSDSGDGENAVLKAIEGLTSKVAEIGGQVKGLEGQVEKAAQAAEEAKTLAKKADEALTAVGGVPQGDQAASARSQGRVRKSGSLPLMDTAVSRPED